MLFKVSISGQRSTRSIDIGKSSCVLGRGKDCDVDINEDLISRKHLNIFMEDDTLYVEELGSSNGSWLNSNKLLAGKKTVYNSGDIIHLGKNSTGVRITVENLSIKKAVPLENHANLTKTLVFAIPEKFEQEIQEIEVMNSKLVSNGDQVARSTEPLPARPALKIAPTINEHRSSLEDKVKNLLSQEADKLLQHAKSNSSEILKAAILKEKEILDKVKNEEREILDKAKKEEREIIEKALAEAKIIVHDAQYEASESKKNSDEEIILLQDKIESLKGETQELIKNFKATTVQIDNTIKNLNNEESKIQQNIKSLEYSVTSIQDKIKSESSILNDIKMDAATLKKTVEMKLEEVVIEERRARARIETEIIESKIQTSKIFAEAEKIQSQKYILEAEISDLRSNKGQIEREVNDLQINYKRQEYDLEKLSRDYQNISNERLTLQSDCENLINEEKKLTAKYIDKEYALIAEQRLLQEKVDELRNEASEIINQAENKAHQIIQTAQTQASNIAEESEGQLKDFDLEKSRFFLEFENEKKRKLHDLELEKSAILSGLENERISKIQLIEQEINQLKTAQLAELKSIEERKVNIFQEIKWQEDSFNKKNEKTLAKNKEEFDSLKDILKIENEKYKANLDKEYKSLKVQHFQENEASKAHALSKLQELKELALKQVAQQKNQLMIEISAKNEEITKYNNLMKLKAEKLISDEKNKWEIKHQKLDAEIEKAKQISRRQEAALAKTEALKDENFLEANEKIKHMMAESRAAILVAEKEASLKREKNIVDLESMKEHYEGLKIAERRDNAETSSLAVQEYLTMEMAKKRNLVLNESLIKKLAEVARKLVVEASLGQIQASENGIKLLPNKKSKKIPTWINKLFVFVALLFIAFYAWTNYPKEILNAQNEVKKYINDNKKIIDEIPSKDQIIEMLR